MYLAVYPVPLTFFHKNQKNFDEAKSCCFFYSVFIFHETFVPADDKNFSLH